MPRQTTEKNRGVPQTIPVIDPNAVYWRPQLRALLNLPRDTLRAEIAAGRLRVAKRGKRQYILGAWVLDWIRAGELRKTAQEPRSPATEG